MGRPDLTGHEEEQLNEEQPLDISSFARWFGEEAFELIPQIEDYAIKDNCKTIWFELVNGQTVTLTVSEVK